MPAASAPTPVPPASPAAADTTTSGAAAPATPKVGGSPATTATPRATPSETVLTGKVVAGGLAAAPTTSLAIEGGTPTTLTGPLEPELRRLGGATVWVTGTPVAGPNATFSVTRYEIVSIDGAKPLVGRVVSREGATWLATERDTVKLLSAPSELTTRAGAKVWVVGRRAGRDLTTQSYGVIREP